MTFRNKYNHSVVVELVGEAQLRIAETKRPAVVYRRGEKLFVRTSQEFAASFEQIKPQTA